MRKLFSVLTFAGCLFLAGGCGSDPRSQVTGTVTVGGKGPLTGGSVYFVSVADEKRMGSGIVHPDGTFSVPDAPIGECKVFFDNSHLASNSQKGGMGMPPGGGMGAGMMGMKGAPKMSGSPGAGGPPSKDKDKMSGPPKGADIPAEMKAENVDYTKSKFMKIDPKHTRAESTPHRFTVNSGANTATFDLN